MVDSQYLLNMQTQFWEILLEICLSLCVKGTLFNKLRISENDVNVYIHNYDYTFCIHCLPGTNDYTFCNHCLPGTNVKVNVTVVYFCFVNMSHTDTDFSMYSS